jgi:hypothetical protein
MLFALTRDSSARRRTPLMIVGLLVFIGGEMTPVTIADDIDESWVQAVEAALADEMAASRQGIAEVLAFFAPDVVVDDRAWTGDAFEGREALRTHLVESYGSTVDEIRLDAAFVDADGALLQLDLTYMRGLGGPAKVAQVRDYNASGVGFLQNYVAISTLRARPGALGGDVFDAWEALARGYVEASSALELVSFPGSDDPSIYLDARLPQLARSAVVVVAAEDPDACPVLIAAVLTVEDWTIASERRFRHTESIRGCADEEPDGGWWRRSAAAGSPAPTSSTVVVGGRDVEIRGSSAALDGLVEWGLQRFREAGLEPPPLTGITFTSATTACAGIAGHAVGGDVLLCLDQDEVCRGHDCDRYGLKARTTVLHEFAHVWLEARLDDESRETYLARTGLSAWRGSAEVPWKERGAERAAETMMWGLLDQLIELPRIDNPTCWRLLSEFRHLTGVEALVEPCRGPGPS